MRIHLTLLGGALLDLTIGEEYEDEEPATFGVAASIETTERGEGMLDTSDRASR